MTTNDSRLRKQHKLAKVNKTVEKVLEKSLVHQEGIHANHSAYKTGNSSADAHIAAHH